MAEEQRKIPTSKIRRASKFARTGLKVGTNYVKHYSRKLVQPDLDREVLDSKNAEEIYQTLSELKGSALKVAQMLSMDKGVLPKAYSERFLHAQYNAPALSGPLIAKTFRQYFGANPKAIFDEFSMEAAHAASIGQVHRAKKEGEDLAVKIQYPGVGASVISDLKLVRPIARRMFGWKDKDLDEYFQEVQARLVEETDYELELERSQFLSERCAELDNLVFPTYYPEYCAERVITMSWLEGMHLDAFLATNPSQAIRDQVGQALWDFYNFQVHQLKMMHADAHPGNFLFQEEGKVGVLDFGCVKEIPEAFYQSYFRLLNPAILEDEAALLESCYAAGILLPDDSEEEIALYMGIFKDALLLVVRPFHQPQFDFGDDAYFEEIYTYGEKMGRDPALRQSRQPRGDKDGLYMNRAYFGLFSILNKLKARVETRRYMPTF
ncbi:MAG: AarF/ABC1/UbiB kinase family protein [Bacteroidota bacterium]